MIPLGSLAEIAKQRRLAITMKCSSIRVSNANIFLQYQILLYKFHSVRRFHGCCHTGLQINKKKLSPMSLYEGIKVQWNFKLYLKYFFSFKTGLAKKGR